MASVPSDEPATRCHAVNFSDQSGGATTCDEDGNTSPNNAGDGEESDKPRLQRTPTPYYDDKANKLPGGGGDGAKTEEAGTTSGGGGDQAAVGGNAAGTGPSKTFRSAKSLTRKMTREFSMSRDDDCFD